MKPVKFYGLHFVKGVAEYKKKGQDPFRVLIEEKCAKEMDPTFVGCPVYVLHNSDVDYDDKMEIDGYVSNSFFNPLDGNHWAEFLVTTEKGLEAIRNKQWKLSNCYSMEDAVNVNGKWHGVDYSKEVKRGKYDHMAIVPDPRYAESVILTPEEFKAYNSKKEIELKQLSNSKDPAVVEKQKGAKKMKFNIFKREKLENALDLSEMEVTLPSTKRAITLENAIEMADKLENMHGYASDDHMVKMSDSEEMPVSKMRDCYNKMKNDEKERLDAEAKKSGAAVATKEVENMSDEEKKKKMEAEKATNALALEEAKKNFEKLSNASANKPSLFNSESIDNDSSMLSRGKNRYGSAAIAAKKGK
jgi:hypothetical protein